MAEDLGKCGATLGLGVSHCCVGLRGTMDPVVSLRSEVTSGAADALDSVAATESESLAFSSAGLASSSLWAPAASLELVTAGVGAGNVDFA